MIYYPGYICFYVATVVAITTRKKEGQAIAFFLSFSSLLSHFASVAFRSFQSGSDTESYLYNFHLIQEGHQLPEKEILFQTLLNFFSFINLSDRGFYIVITATFILFFFLLFRKFDWSIGLVIIFGFLSSSTFFDLETNGLRQGLASLLGLIGLLFFKRCRLVIILILAGFLHYSAFIFLPPAIAGKFPFLKNAYFIKIIALFVGISTLLFSMGYNPISLNNFDFLPPNFIFDRFLGYTENDIKGSFEGLSAIGRLSYALPCFLITAFSFSLPKEENFRFLYLIFLFFVIFYFLVSSTGYSYRWSYFSLLLTPILATMYFSKIKNQTAKFSFLLILITVFFLWGSYAVWFGKIYHWS